jgi:hypothetical protein
MAVKRQSILFIGLTFFLLALFSSSILGLWVKQELENRMKTEIQGRFSPVYFQPTFYLQDVHLKWKDKVEVLSGDLKVDYDLFSLLGGNSLRVKISGQNISTKLLGDWSQMGAPEQVEFENVYADLGFGRKGLQQIYGLSAKSPVWNFEIGEKAAQ